MKFSIYTIVIITVVAILGGVALWRALPSPSSTDATDVSALDGDGDHDGDPIEAVPDEESLTATTTVISKTPTPAPVPVTPKPKPSGYTMAQVTTHASAESCWTAIEGNVYDLTSWISKHPGGKSAILKLCGKDGTAAFNEQHGGESRPEKELATFKIGALI